MTVSSLPRDWIAAPFLRLLFQNLIVEERADIREVTLAAWRMAVTILHEYPDWLTSVASEQLLFDWYAIIMTPLGVAIDLSNWFTVAADRMDSAPERHNVDKNMLSQDLSLVTIEITLKARVAAATALANLLVYWSTDVSCSSYNQQPPRLICVLLESRSGNYLPTNIGSLHRFHQHASEVFGSHYCGGMGKGTRICSPTRISTTRPHVTTRQGAE